MFKYALMIAILLCSFGDLVAKELTRGTFLGLVPESAAAGQAVVIQWLHPQGTAHALGLKEGDQLLTVNDNPVSDFSSLVNILGSIYEGSPVTVKIKRDNQELNLSATAQGRPRERGEGFSVDYDQFQWHENIIRTIIYTPDSQRADKASVMYIQGYTCGSIDHGMAPELTMNQLLATYAEAGFTVFKMEKPGVGDSEGPLDCMNYDFTIENKAFLAGLDHFKATHDIDAGNVFIFGHSLGVLHGAVFAEKGLVKGVMGYGGVNKSWHDYLVEIYSKQSVKYWGVSKTQAKENTRLIKPFLQDWIQSDKSWDDVLKEQTTKRVQNANLIQINGEQLFNRHYSFFRSINKYDFNDMWSKSKIHVLMMHGTFDIQTIESGWQDDIVAKVNANSPGKGTALKFPRTEHSLMRYEDLDSLLTAMRDRTHRVDQPGEHYNPDIAEQSLNWMQGVLEES